MTTPPISVESDTILARPLLPHTAVFYPYGYPVRVSSNSLATLSAAEESWGGDAQRIEAEPLAFDCHVESGGQGHTLDAPTLRVRRNVLVSVLNEQNFAYTDLEGGHGMAWVTEAVAENLTYFRYHFLEAVVYSLLDIKYIVSVHAACVERNGHGVLLAGESGAGKSSLSYACARRGWTYVADDASSLVMEGDDRIVLGTPKLFRFRGSAGSLFPEFQGWAESKRANGKPTIEVQTKLLSAIRTAEQSRVDYIVFLNRSATSRVPAALLPLSREYALSHLYLSQWPAELPSVARRRVAIERLLGVGIYELQYSTLDEAIALLNTLTDVTRGHVLSPR